MVPGERNEPKMYQLNWNGLVRLRRQKGHQGRPRIIMAWLNLMNYVQLYMHRHGIMLGCGWLCERISVSLSLKLERQSADAFFYFISSQEDLFSFDFSCTISPPLL